jgi:hypothetical protein
MQKRREEVHDFMASVEAQTKDLLSKIKEIDSDVVQRQAEYHNFATSIIHSKRHSRPTSPNNFTEDPRIDPDAPAMEKL